MLEDAPVASDIIAPNRKVLFQKIGEFLDDLGDPGVYMVRVYMVKDGENVKRPAKASFTVTVFMYVP